MDCGVGRDKAGQGCSSISVQEAVGEAAAALPPLPVCLSLSPSLAALPPEVDVTLMYLSVSYRVLMAV